MVQSLPVIDISSLSAVVVSGMKQILSMLQEIQVSIGNITASFWIWLIAFFAIEVIVYALYNGVEIK